MRSFAVLLPFAAAVMALSTNPPQCMKPEVRVEWRTITQAQRDSYHKAVKCLQTKPSPEFKGRSLYDRFAWSYDIMDDRIHQVAAFLPWHRYFSVARTRLLKDCGYNGPTPYWDWTKDVNNMTKSEIFDPIKGFGGNSEGNGLCVQGGPYGTKSKFTLTWPWNQCLRRDFNDMESTPGKMFRPATGPAGRHSLVQVKNLNNKKRFSTFAPALEEGLHQSVLDEISPLMASSFSPLDPLFFLHINNVDRLWALWQENDERRLKEYENIFPIKLKTAPTATPPATLNDQIYIAMKEFPAVRVRDLMDTLSPTLCYKYQ